MATGRGQQWAKFQQPGGVVLLTRTAVLPNLAGIDSVLHERVIGLLHDLAMCAVVSNLERGLVGVAVGAASRNQGRGRANGRPRSYVPTATATATR
jgi:hypothetical protein